ncbi:MAG: CAP domain-containing protein [Candidatus Syntrophosphaera sp.]|nr:CAP domain-containing protein [Candidatus Syntrophosphaera sp.]
MALLGNLGAESVGVEEFERRIFESVNAARAESGIRPLASDPGLVDLARTHSRNMAWQGFFSHRDKQGLQVSQRLEKYHPELLHAGIGENLYYLERSDRKYDPAQIVNGWMNSAEHRANLLQPEYTHTGIGIFLMGNKLYTTQVYAIPILRLLSPLPGKLSRGKSYVLEFEYLSPISGEDLQFLLATPDPKARIRVNDFVYHEGMIPLNVIWRDKTRLSLVLAFPGGKGTYSLQVGWDGYFYTDMLKFRVK